MAGGSVSARERQRAPTLLPRLTALARQTTRCGVVEEQPNARGEKGKENDRGKPGIELGKRGEQESCGEAWGGEGVCAENSAIVTFVEVFCVHFLQDRAKIDGIRMPSDLYYACLCTKSTLLFPGFE